MRGTLNENPKPINGLGDNRMNVMKSWGIILRLSKSMIAFFKALILASNSFPLSYSLIWLVNAGVPLSKWTRRVEDFSDIVVGDLDLRNLEGFKGIWGFVNLDLELGIEICGV